MVHPSRLGGQALARLLPDLTALPGPMYAALARAVTALVLDGRIAAETRLPSERELAGALVLSRATVTAAYDSLRSEGFLESRTGAGSFVCVPDAARARPALSGWHLTTGRGDDVIDMTRATLPAAPGVVADAVAGAPARLAAHLLHDGYDPVGLPELRTVIAERFASRGLPTRPDQVLVTNGSLHGLDLILRLLLGPGERVVTELPTYPGALDAVRANGGRIVPVPMAPDGGWQVEHLCTTLRQASARLAVLTPDFHNPTGSWMPEHERRDVLRAAHRSGTTVIVDETFAELGYDGHPPLSTAALDPTVITVGSLSKPVWGGLRTGWVRGPAELIRRLAALRTSIDLGGPVLDQLVAATLVPQLDDIVANRLDVLRPRRDALLAALGEHLPRWRAARPAGGMSLWVELDAPLSTPLSVLAAQAGVLIVPGSRFGVDGTLERFVRLPFALPADRLQEAVRRLAEVWSGLDHTGLGARQLIVA